MNLGAVKGFLDIGMVPVLGGDIVQDAEMGFSVGSGDQVAAILAEELGVTDLVFATDVDGVYDSDPKKNPGERLIPEVNLSRGVAFASSTNGDASGAMKGKIGALTDLTPEIEAGLNVAIISMMEPGRLSRLLHRKHVTSTRIKV